MTIPFVNIKYGLKSRSIKTISPSWDVSHAAAGRVPGSAGEPGSGSRGLFLRAGREPFGRGYLHGRLCLPAGAAADRGTLHPGRGAYGADEFIRHAGQIRPGRESAGAGSGARASA